MRFRSDPSAIRGSLAALIAPFNEDGSPDLVGLRSLIEWQIAQGTHGISVGGSTSEPTSQTHEERLSAIRFAGETVAGRVPFLAGAGAGTLAETLDLIAEADRVGADAVLVVTPYYTRPTQEGLYRWYSTIAEEFPDLPIVVYNVPSRAAVDIAPETVARLRRDRANIVGIKDTTRDFQHFSDVLYHCGRDFMVWSGIEALCLPLLALGGSGFVTALSNVAPRSVARMFDLWEAGEHEEARELHYALHPLATLLFVETNPAPAKWVLQHYELIASAHVRPPLSPLTPSSEAIVVGLLEEASATMESEGLAVRIGPRATTRETNASYAESA